MFRSLIHVRVPDRLHGRAFAAYNGIRNGAELGAFAAGGVLVAVIGPTGTLAYAGGLSALAGLIGLLALIRMNRGWVASGPVGPPGLGDLGRHRRGAGGVNEERKKGVEAEREPNFLLAPFERRFLPWLAGKLPRWILPDDMTALGVLAAFGICARLPALERGLGLALGRERPAGRAVARATASTARWPESGSIQRPKYGFYLDHMVDAISTAAIGIGLGPVAVHAALDRDADRGRLPDPLDQRLPGEHVVRPLPARLRLPGPDRDPRGPDPAEHRAGARPRASTSTSSSST